MASGSRLVVDRPSTMFPRRKIIAAFLPVLAVFAAAVPLALANEESDWGTRTREALLIRSPKSLAATLAAIRRARKLGSLEEALNVELRLCLHLFEDGEFVEGVRALLVDKDKKPRWNPPSLAELDDAMIEALFSPLPAGQELGLRPPA